MEHRFEYRSGDFSLCFTGERAYVEAMAARYAPVPEGPAEPGAPRARPLRVTKNISLRDFIHLKEAASAADVVLTMAYYLEKYDYLPNYDLDDLRPYLADVALAAAEVQAALAAASRRGLLVEDQGRYSLSFSGEQAVKYGEFPTGLH